jgi:hypothetical protein
MSTIATEPLTIEDVPAARMPLQTLPRFNQADLAVEIRRALGEVRRARSWPALENARNRYYALTQGAGDFASREDVEVSLAHLRLFSPSQALETDFGLLGNTLEAGYLIVEMLNSAPRRYQQQRYIR